MKFDSFTTKFSTGNFSLREKNIMCRHSVISDSLFTTDHPYNHIWHADLRLKEKKKLIMMILILVVAMMMMMMMMTIIKQKLAGHWFVSLFVL